MEEPGQHDLWRQWFQEQGPRLLLCARLWTRSLADAEDVLQEGFVRFWRHQRHLGGDPQALLVTSIRRAAWDLGRREGRREAGELDQAGASWFIEPPMEERDRHRLLEDAVRRLPDAQREVVVLKVWGGLTFDDIARELSISPNTAASRYRYALETLRKELTFLCHG